MKDYETGYIYHFSKIKKMYQTLYNNQERDRNAFLHNCFTTISKMPKSR